MATSPHTSSEGNPSNKGRPKVADCLKKVGDPAHSPEKRRYPNLSSHLGPGRTRTSTPTQAVEAENSRYPNLSTRKTLRRHSHSRGPAGPNLVGGYENAASLVFLPCFSPADSQNRLAASEGRDVLGENKRILPPILSRGVAFPSQMWQFGQTESNEITRDDRPLGEEPAGGGHTIGCVETGLYRGCLPQTRGLSPGCMASTIFSPPVACTWREDTVEGEGPRGGKRLPLECVVKEEHHNLPGPHSQQPRENPGATSLRTSSRTGGLRRRYRAARTGTANRCTLPPSLLDRRQSPHRERQSVPQSAHHRAENAWRGETSPLLQYDNIPTVDETTSPMRVSTPKGMTTHTASTVNAQSG